MAEGYALIKFEAECVDARPLALDGRMKDLIGYCSKFARLGFSKSYAEIPEDVRRRLSYPDHGSEGNLSCREEGNVFTVTGSQLESKRHLSSRDFARVRSVNFKGNTAHVIYEGARTPSSESLLHAVIYMTMPGVNAIFHGHDDEAIAAFEKTLETHKDVAIDGVGFTDIIPEAGTRQTSDATLKALEMGTDFAIIRSHGFVSVGESMHDTFAAYLTGVKRVKKFLSLEDTA